MVTVSEKPPMRLKLKKGFHTLSKASMLQSCNENRKMALNVYGWLPRWCLPCSWGVCMHTVKVTHCRCQCADSQAAEHISLVADGPQRNHVHAALSCTWQDGHIAQWYRWNFLPGSCSGQFTLPVQEEKHNAQCCWIMKCGKRTRVLFIKWVKQSCLFSSRVETMISIHILRADHVIAVTLGSCVGNPPSMHCGDSFMDIRVIYVFLLCIVLLMFPHSSMENTKYKWHKWCWCIIGGGYQLMYKTLFSDYLFYNLLESILNYMNNYENFCR